MKRRCWRELTVGTLLLLSLVEPGLRGFSQTPANLFPNPTLETDANRDGLPDFWNRGGTAASACVWDTNSFASARHSLRVDDRSSQTYGEWYSDLVTVSPTNVYEFRFKRRYATSGVMRLSVNFHDSSEAFLATATFSVHGTNLAWTEASLELPIPAAARRLRLSLASGGGLEDTGQISLDDVFLIARPRTPLPPGTIRRVDSLPARPTPAPLRDWRRFATNYDRLIFDLNRTGQFMPLNRLDSSQPNFALEGHWLPSYVGSTTHGGEAINSLAAVLGATLAGLDKSNQGGRNWVQMQAQFYNEANGEGLVLNLPNTSSGQTFWYEIYPHILFYALVDKYPETARVPLPLSHRTGSVSMEEIVRRTAELWREAAGQMGGKTNRADFNWTAFDFGSQRPVFNGRWREPDAAAGIAWLECMAYAKFRDSRFLEAARWGMDALERTSSSPIYENLLPFGALVAARLNAEQKTTYNLQKLVDGCFDANGSARYGVGMISGSWGSTPVDGLIGVATEVGGYAFAMNTFSQVGALAPIARYDPRFARSLGKWLLYVAHHARWFYPDAFGPDQQSSSFWKEDADHVIPYEGLRHEWDGKIPFASGDPIFYQWGPKTDLALYGGSHVGLLGGMQHPTSQSNIVAWDLLATDHFHAPAQPTFLCYNPEAGPLSVILPTFAQANMLLYDAVTGGFLSRNAAQGFVIPGTQATVISVVSATAALATEGSRLLADGVPIDYRLGRQDTDSDGLPDWWESRYFAQATAASPHALGANHRTLLECFQLGLDPGQTGAEFRILSALRTQSGEIELRWTTVGGRSYRVELTSGLSDADPSFQTIGTYQETNVIAGAAGVGRWVHQPSAVDPAPRVGGGFYRIRLVTE